MAKDARDALRTWAGTALAMLAFASNSLLCRAALRRGDIDPASFTALRLVSGALILALLVRPKWRGRWRASALSALALFAYAALFSTAYLQLSAGVGALTLFGSVQISMLTIGQIQGQRLASRQMLGAACALSGLVALTLPVGTAFTPPPLEALVMMAGAGVAWGIYSVRGRTAGDPVHATARNFVLTVPVVALWWWTQGGARDVTVHGGLLALASGGLASGLGYVIWYSALRGLSALEAALVQLTVPVITALAGVLMMGEVVTPRLLCSGALIVAGIALAVVRR